MSQGQTTTDQSAIPKWAAARMGRLGGVKGTVGQRDARRRQIKVGAAEKTPEEGPRGDCVGPFPRSLPASLYR